MSRKLRVRQAQTVLPFGVGAVLEVQGESFVAAGIRDWPARRPSVRSPRLASQLRVTGFFAAPPVLNDRYDVAGKPGAPYVRFPTWLFCGSCRRMTKWCVADEKPGTPPQCQSCSPTRRLAPMRFVRICQAGHLDDVDWWYWAHSRSVAQDSDRCDRSQPLLRFQVSDRAAGLEALSIRCHAPGCGAFRDLLDLLDTRIMRCSGRNPWQPASERVTCNQRAQVVQRTAGNVYYPIVYSALDIPEAADAAVPGEAHVVDRIRASLLWPAFCQAVGTPKETVLREMIKDETGAVDDILDAVLADELGTEALTRPTSAGATAAETHVHPDLSRAEWHALTADHPASTRTFSVRRGGLGLESAVHDPWVGLSRRINRVVLADRLREVRALQGFSRVSPSGAFVPVDTSHTLRWLPAIEVFGEGVFLTLASDVLADWEANELVRDRVAVSRSRLAGSLQRERLEPHVGASLQARFILLHTFSHLLIRQLSFESGYSAASLRERIYARAEDGQAGVLIYTAAGDAEGTLGGLVAQGEAPRLAETLIAMTEAAAWCSGDPLCAEHSGQGFGSLNRAACHACALLPETSCETGNTLLDRVLVVGGQGVPGFFEDIIAAARADAAIEAEAEDKP